MKRARRINILVYEKKKGILLKRKKSNIVLFNPIYNKIQFTCTFWLPSFALRMILEINQDIIRLPHIFSIINILTVLQAVVKIFGFCEGTTQT